MDKATYATKNKLNQFLRFLGLTHEEIKLLLSLTSSGPQTILQLSKSTGINRTKVYRMMELLIQKGVIKEIIDQHKKLFQTADSSTLELLIKKQETQSKFLREVYPEITPLIESRKAIDQPGTKVLFYRGPMGLRQQIWNVLKTKGEAVGYSYRPLGDIIGKYDILWYEEWSKRKILFRDLYSDEYLKARKSKETIDSIDHTKIGINSRYISPSALSINHQLDIYNDVTSHYNWHEGEIFGVEIYNEKVASLQKQLFEIVWKLAKSQLKK
ncbi:helix-turn-helix domain-containing protein [Patescibacteria group bacterium]|nr:helix-turn-helix domain-containing protein [Patescibacteria group bacterium]